MEIQWDLQWKYFLWSLLSGVFIAVIYDLLRVSRKAVHTKDIIINLEDILFIIMAGVVLFMTAHFKNNGELRWHGILGTAAGYLLYKLLFGDIVLNVLTQLLKILKKILIFILKIILSPLFFLYKLFRRPARCVAWYTRKGAGRARNTLKVQRTKIKNSLKASANSMKKK